MKASIMFEKVKMLNNTDTMPPLMRREIVALGKHSLNLKELRLRTKSTKRSSCANLCRRLEKRVVHYREEFV